MPSGSGDDHEIMLPVVLGRLRAIGPTLEGERYAVKPPSTGLLDDPLARTRPLSRSRRPDVARRSLLAAWARVDGVGCAEELHSP